MQKIVYAFSQESGQQVLVALGSTGKLYAQIKNGAPFHLLLAADTATPEKLEKEGLVVLGSRFTYASGRLVLWSTKQSGVDQEGKVLRSSAFKYLALADPKVSPYGAAAVQVMDRLGVYRNLESRLVQGESVAQAYQFVASGNAELGFVALSQVMQKNIVVAGSAWLVPKNLHAPLHQDAAVLIAAKDNPTVNALVAYLQSEKARQIMRGYGYEH
jgi:molybdate transport system substrate-binding protein